MHYKSMTNIMCNQPTMYDQPMMTSVYHISACLLTCPSPPPHPTHNPATPYPTTCSLCKCVNSSLFDVCHQVDH